MAGIRRSLVLASIERYFAVAVNLIVVIVVARILMPAEYGLSVLGSAVLAIVEVVCNFGVSAYLVQQQQLTPEKIRTAFTVTGVLTLALVGPLMLVAGPIAEFYGLVDLRLYLQVIALAFCLTPIISPISALLRREMAFGTLALISMLTSFLNALVTVGLALSGFSYMSFAWAGLASGVASALLCLFFRPDITIFRPTLREWRSVMGFGAFDGGIVALGRVWEYFPYLILGRILNAEAVGLYQRAWLICKLPDRILLAGIHSVALPALAAHAREGRDLKVGFLTSIEYITSVLWPALLLLIIFAHPTVLLLLGSRWHEVAPLLQIMAAAQLFAFPTSVTYPTLVAAGAMRNLLLLTILQVGSSLVIVSFAATQGLHAAALSMWFTVPFNVFLSVCLVRFHVPFRWFELASATRKSAIVALASSVGPLIVLALAGSSAAVSIVAAALGIALSAMGWLGALWFTDHPLLHELLRGKDVLLNHLVDTRTRVAGWRVSQRPKSG